MSAPVGIDELLERVRAGYTRVGAREAYEASLSGALLVDIRYQALRERDGLIPGALVVERNELEWRLDPLGSHRAPEATGHDLRVVVVCNEATLQSRRGLAPRAGVAPRHGPDRGLPGVEGRGTARHPGVPRVLTRPRGRPRPGPPVTAPPGVGCQKSSVPSLSPAFSPSASSARRTTRRAMPSG